MKIVCNNKRLNIINCKTFYQRLKGFMFDKKIDKCLLFDKCNSIHTFFMKQNIDVIMCDKNNIILYIYRDLKKNNIIWPKKGVRKVIETPTYFFDFKIGDEVVIK